jgi:CRP-like cAMP-binding protein
MARDELTRMRAELGRFADLPDPEWDYLCSLLYRRDIGKGEYFLREGEPPEHIAFIEQGLFRVFMTTEGGEERTLVFRAEGRLLAGYSPFLTHGISQYSIQALETGVIFDMGLERFVALIARHSCWERLSSGYAQMLFVEKERREREFLSEDAEGRYRRFLENYPGLESRLAQYQIASYLGITPVALSRIRGRRWPRPGPGGEK